MSERELSTRDLAGAAGEHEREELKVGSLEITPPGERAEPLLPEEETDQLSARWHDIQAGFVDEPRVSVEQADALVAHPMRRLAAASRTSGSGSSRSGTAATTSRPRTFASR
jgi:hypothetical protein